MCVRVFSRQAYTATHITFMVLGALGALLYIVAVPAVALLSIVRYSHRAADEHFRRVLGFLFDGYKSKYCYW